MSVKILPFQLADNFKVGYFYYFPLSCMLTCNEYKDWYYMNYIDVIGIAREVVRDEKTYTNFDLRFLDGESYYSRRISANTKVMFDEYDLNLVELKRGIIHFIKENIDMQKYVVLYLNTQQLGNENDNRFHIHDIFIYGYDDEKKIINASYMAGERDYEVFEVPYSAIEKGFEDYMQCTFTVKDKKRMIITFYLTNSTAALDPNDTHCYVQSDYDFNMFLHKIKCYLDGKVSGGKVIVSDNQKIKSLYCGIESYNLFFDYLRELTTGLVQTTSRGGSGYDAYDFMFPFYYTNHKKSIYERLNYAYDMTGKDIFCKVANEYVQVVEKMELIKNKHMRLSLGKGILTNKIYDEFCSRLEEVKVQEKNILSNLI